MSFIDKQHTNRNATSQVIAYDGSTTTSTAFATSVIQARLAASTACHYKIGAAGVSATVSDVMLPANVFEYITVNPGEYVAAIKVSGGTAGILSVTDLT